MWIGNISWEGDRMTKEELREKMHDIIYLVYDETIETDTIIDLLFTAILQAGYRPIPEGYKEKRE